MKKVLYLLLVNTLWWTLAPGIYAVPTHIHIGKQQEYPPYIFEENGKTVGICAEFAEAAFARLGISVSYTQYPFARMLESGRSGRVDAVMLVFKTSERETFLYYPKYALHYEENAFFTRRPARISYSGALESLQGYRIGVVRGFSYGELFDSATFIDKDESLDDEALLRKLLHGRYQLAVGNKSVISYHAQQMGVIDDIEFLRPYLFERKPLYIGFSKANPENEELAIRFSEVLATLKHEGVYQRIVRKYSASDEGGAVPGEAELKSDVSGE
ncbi:MAG: transporter substrate-binding domain-containing protein [Gammaproteobacteria bacterium]|nr:transporter substrate-binding domain-containing protein [Gammaproteobacteria bacterium]